MFTSGQLIFSICFIVVFVIIMIFSYKRDKKLHRKHFKGSAWILLGFLIFVALLMLVKVLLKD